MALLAEVDIKNAFRLLSIYPGDFELLGIYINGAYYIEKCLPFGCSISCKIFEPFSTFLEWAVKFKTQLDTVHHYLDDFIFIGKSNSDNCSALMHTFQDICSEIGVPLNQDKTIEPTTKLTFLGLEIDTVNMLVQIPVSKVQELKLLLQQWVAQKKNSSFPVRIFSGQAQFLY